MVTRYYCANQVITLIAFSILALFVFAVAVWMLPGNGNLLILLTLLPHICTILCGVSFNLGTLAIFNLILISMHFWILQRIFLLLSCERYVVTTANWTQFRAGWHTCCAHDECSCACLAYSRYRPVAVGAIMYQWY